MIDDPYRVLGLTREATKDEVKAAYKKLAKQYHPDLNKDSKLAEAKMKEINEAYTAIMKGETGGQTGGYGAGGYGAGAGGYGGYRGYGSYGGGAGNNWGGYAQGESSQMTAVRNYINSGYYREALNLLQRMSDRTARWYYYSAAANAGLGNRLEALEHARRAAQMEPGNPEYKRLLDELQYGASEYRSFGEGFGTPSFNPGNICLGLCLARLFCGFCGGPCC